MPSSRKLQERLESLTPAQRQQVIDRLRRRVSGWKPNPGPQTAAYQCQADILFYGGAAGGGKTDLGLGLAHLEHFQSIIFRRVFPNLRGSETRAREMFAPETGYNEQLHRWKLKDGRQIEFGSLQYDKDVSSHQGQPHDLYVFDEITEFSEAQFRFVIGWNRSTRKGQRSRVVCTGNPPMDADGEWVIQFWGPWLDENHPNPALPGELRWYTTIAGRDEEVPNGDPVLVNGELVKPLSRTFIPALLEDNPYLAGTDYLAKIQAMPEPMRSKMLYGDFKAGREDATQQVIPTEWVKAAQDRWTEDGHVGNAMSALGVDVARGGKDKTVITPRHGNWFGRAWSYPGKATPDGPAVAALVLEHHQAGATVLVDIIGVGGSVYDTLKDCEGLRVEAINGAAKSGAKDKSGMLGFYNLRAQNWWKLREDLDPASGQDIAFPPDPELRADLCAPTWKLTTRGILVEAKEDIIARIGRSPDRGDSLVYAHCEGATSCQGVLDYWRWLLKPEKDANAV